jgi:hypothetical protein
MSDSVLLMCHRHIQLAYANTWLCLTWRWIRKNEAKDMTQQSGTYNTNLILFKKCLSQTIALHTAHSNKDSIHELQQVYARPCT